MKITKLNEDIKKNLNEDFYEDTPYYEIISKSVQDSDGFYTDYTMYYDTENDNYFFMFGDKDLYPPDPDYADWECDTNDEATEWYNNYNGFEEEDDFDESLELSETMFNNEFDSVPGDTVTFETKGMEVIPQVGEYFRVGPLTGECIESNGESVTMKVEGNTFLREDVLEVELPDVEIPAVEIAPEASTETPTIGPEAGISNLLINAIKDEWDTINLYNDLVLNAEANGFNEISTVLKDIAAEENNHVGMLQRSLKELSPNVENVQLGEVEAEETLKEDWNTAKRWSLEDKKQLKKFVDNLYVYLSEEYIDSALVQVKKILSILNKIKEDSPKPKEVMTYNESLFTSEQALDRFQSTGKITNKIRDELNKIVSKYCGFKKPSEIRPMWEELSNSGIEVDLISGFGKEAETGARSWSVGYRINDIPVVNSSFQYSFYEPLEGEKNDYNIYFS